MQHCHPIRDLLSILVTTYVYVLACCMTTIVSGITRERLKYKKQYGQQMIARMTRNGYYLI